MRIVLAGSGLLVTQELKAILGSSHEVVGLIQNGRRIKGMRRWFMPLVMRILPTGKNDRRGLARRHGIPLVYIDKMTEDELAPLRALDPDLILVAGFSIILKKPILELPRIGCVNTHSSLLPKHRGPNPFSAAIMANESETGVTFHVMDEAIDTGHIIEQHCVPVKPTHYALDLHRLTARLAGEKVVALLDRIEAEGLQGTPQDNDLASYDKNMTKEQAFIQWDQPAEDINRLVRASFPHNVARFRHGDRVIYVHRCSVKADAVDAPPGTVLTARPKPRVATGQGTIELTTAYVVRPVPWVWPGALTNLAEGDVLE
ncbi:MAG: methionyl-tRNA formyltransferase [bacterium]|nr:methionyl-tRNA formyltransferase [bacterium]